MSHFFSKKDILGYPWKILFSISKVSKVIFLLFLKYLWDYFSKNRTEDKDSINSRLKLTFPALL